MIQSEILWHGVRFNNIDFDMENILICYAELCLLQGSSVGFGSNNNCNHGVYNPTPLVGIKLH
jgi:hypothetical protein